MRLIDADEYAYWVIDHMTTPWDRAKKHISNDYDKGLYDATLLLNTMPTIHPEPHWIPCSERLPEVSGNYLVSEHSPLGEFTCTRYWNQGDRRGYWSGDGYSTVTAWMPLPEPYQEGEG